MHLQNKNFKTATEKGKMERRADSIPQWAIVCPFVGPPAFLEILCCHGGGERERSCLLGTQAHCWLPSTVDPLSLHQCWVWGDKSWEFCQSCDFRSQQLTKQECFPKSYRISLEFSLLGRAFAQSVGSPGIGPHALHKGGVLTQTCNVSTRDGGGQMEVILCCI